MYSLDQQERSYKPNTKGYFLKVPSYSTKEIPHSQLVQRATRYVRSPQQHHTISLSHTGLQWVKQAFLQLAELPDDSQLGNEARLSIPITSHVFMSQEKLKMCTPLQKYKPPYYIRNSGNGEGKKAQNFRPKLYNQGS